MEPGPQFKQLAMFMTADELMHRTEHGDGSNVMHSKLEEAKETGLHESISQNGVRHPVQVWHHDDGSQTLLNGHHRTAVSYDLHPNRLLPVQNDALEPRMRVRSDGAL